MAAPHAAACAALLLDVVPTLTPEDISRILQLTAVDLGPTGKDNDYGAGRIDVYEAVQSILTPLELAYFRAEGRPTGVALSWSYEGPRMTGSFNLLRQADAGRRVRLNAAPVEGRPPFRFADETARAGETYRYWLEYVPATGFSRTYGPVVARAGNRPAAAFAFAAPWPNPAREAVTFAFSLPADDPDAELVVFDLVGRRLATVRRGGRAGVNVVTWSPAATVSPGVYFCRLTAAGNSAVKKLAVVR
jgi:hypothetical protein